MLESYIKEHTKDPQSFRPLEKYTNHFVIKHPECGDCVEIRLLIAEERVLKSSVTSLACPICIASGSIMASHINEEATEDLKKMVDLLEWTFFSNKKMQHNSLSKKIDSIWWIDEISKVKMSLRKKKCFLLPWRGLKRALGGGHE